jgi:hypothetical protein
MRKYNAKIIKTWNPNENGGAYFRTIPVVGDIIIVEKYDVNHYRWSNGGCIDCVVPVDCLEIIKEILDIPYYIWGALIGNKVVYKDGFEFTLKKISIDYQKNPIILIGENNEKLFIAEDCKPVLKKIENISLDDKRKFFSDVEYQPSDELLLRITFTNEEYYLGGRIEKYDCFEILELLSKGYDMLELIEDGLALEKKDE